MSKAKHEKIAPPAPVPAPVVAPVEEPAPKAPERVRTAGEFKKLADEVNRHRDEQDKTLPAQDVIDQGMKAAIHTARVAAEQGRYHATTVLTGANYAAAHKIEQELRESHHFAVQKQLLNNTWQMTLSWQ